MKQLIVYRKAKKMSVAGRYAFYISISRYFPRLIDYGNANKKQTTK